MHFATNFIKLFRNFLDKNWINNKHINLSWWCLNIPMGNFSLQNFCLETFSLPSTRVLQSTRKWTKTRIFNLNPPAYIKAYKNCCPICTWIVFYIRENIHGAKAKLCIWWDQKGVLYYELLKPGETINGDRYRTQLIRFEERNSRKTPRICDQTEGNNFPSWQRSAPCCYSS